MSFDTNENSSGSGKPRTMDEVSKSIRSAGAAKEETKKPSDESDPSKNPTGAVTEPESEVVEPPAPGPLTDQEMAMPPEAFLEPSSSDAPSGASGDNPVTSVQFNPDKDGAGEEVNQKTVDEMGGQGLNDVLKGAFSDFLDGNSKKALSRFKQIQMPGNVDEAKWNKAKEEARKTYSESDKAFWPVVETIYKKMEKK